jgi:hypothetical protein
MLFRSTISETTVHDWVVRRLGGILSSVGHRVKIHSITPATGKGRGDVEIRDYVVLQKPRDLTDCLPPPRTLILDFALTHTRFGKSHLSSLGQLTHTRRTDGAPEPEGVLRTVVRAKIHHYRQLYINRPEPIAFMPVAVDTVGRIYEDRPYSAPGLMKHVDVKFRSVQESHGIKLGEIHFDRAQLGRCTD